MISALCWVPKGAAKQNPEKMNMTEEQYAEIAAKIGAELDIAKEDISTLENQETSEPINDPELADFNLDNYDQEVSETHIPLFSNIQGIKFHSSNEEDPYVQIDDNMDEQQEMEELEIMPSDNLIVTCRTEEELSTLEVYVYNEKENNLYVHHDIMLPSFPLTVEWMDYKTDGQANRVAVGTFEPEIEIWDLDVVDAAFPTLILGSKLDGNGKIIKSKGKKKSKSTTVLPDRHISAVTCLSWNKNHRNLLLSGSADTSIKLWDLESGKAVQSYEHHTDKVVALAWHPTETTVFLSGGYDQGGRVCVLDSRAPGQVQSWLLGSDVECLAWDPFHPERFFVSTENGLVRCYDARNYSPDPLFTIHAHDAAVSALAVNAFVEGLLITGSGDKTVKIWDIRNGQCKCLASKELEVGKVFTAEFCVDSPFVLAVSGSKGKLTLWNLNDNGSVKRHFGIEKETSDRPEILAMPSDNEESDQEEEKEMEDSEKMEESEDDMEE